MTNLYEFYRNAKCVVGYLISRLTNSRHSLKLMHASISYCAVYCNILFRDLIRSIDARDLLAAPTSANHVHAIHAQPSPAPSTSH